MSAKLDKLTLTVVLDAPGLPAEVLDQLAQEAKADLEQALGRRLGNPPAPGFSVVAKSNA